MQLASGLCPYLLRKLRDGILGHIHYEILHMLCTM